MSLLYPRHDSTVPLELELKNLSAQIDALTKREARLRENVVGVPGSTAVAKTAKSLIFVTAVTGSGTITNKVYEADTTPVNKVLTAFESDNDNITLAVHVQVIGDVWQNSWIKASGGGANGVIVNKEDWTELVTDGRVFTAAINMTDADESGTITVESSDGSVARVTYTRVLNPPKVLTAMFGTHAGTTGGDPLVDAAQVSTTSVQTTQTVRITGTTESHATKIWVKAAGVSSVEQGSFAVTAGAFDFTIDVRSSGNTEAQTVTLECAVEDSGTRGATFNTTNTVTVSHTVPTFTGGAQSDIAYPASQEALKDSETCTVTVTHTNAAAGDTYLYDDNSTSELTIPSTTTYVAAKASVQRSGGSYRETGTNYRLIATRTAQNGTATTKSVTVKIAHTMPTLTVTPSTRFRTDDGTSGYKDTTVTITSHQANLSTYAGSVTMLPAAGDTSAFTSGTWSANGDLAYTNTLRVEDADIKAGGQAANDFTWITISVKNRAGKEATTITTNPNYSIGGFAKRRLTIPAWTNREATTSVFIVNTVKLTAELLSKGGGGPAGGTIQTFDNSPGEGLTPDDEVDKFCISNGSDIVDNDGKFYFNKDQPAAEANSGGTAQVDIEETA